jgi:ChaC-like protein
MYSAARVANAASSGTARVQVSRAHSRRFACHSASSMPGELNELERRVREMYDYEAVIVKAPAPESVEWVFGYGSILFKQGFVAGDCIAGYIEGWRRAFYQQSTGVDRTQQRGARTGAWSCTYNPVRCPLWPAQPRSQPRVAP